VALTPDTVLRTDDAAGDSFLTFLDGSARRVQAVAVVNLNGDPMGVSGTPLVAEISNAVLIDSSTPIDVNIASTTHTHTHTVHVTAGGAVSEAVISGDPATLVEFRAILDSAVAQDRYVMFFDDDGAALPITPGTAPFWRLLVPAGSEASETWNPSGLQFPTDGIVVVVSSTIATLTQTGAEAYFSAVSYV
jgi:hypothetical protein